MTASSYKSWILRLYSWGFGLSFIESSKRNFIFYFSFKGYFNLPFFSISQRQHPSKNILTKCSYLKKSHLWDWSVSAVFPKQKAVEQKVYKKEKILQIIFLWEILKKFCISFLSNIYVKTTAVLSDMTSKGQFKVVPNQ